MDVSVPVMVREASLADIPRHELVAAALELGVERPDRLTAEELAEQIRAANSPSVPPRPVPTASWLSVARNLVASVIEQGLNLPEAARVIRATVTPVPRQRPPLPTVTLAQIYLAQRHTERARATLEQVLRREPDNFKAQSLLARLNADEREQREVAEELTTESAASRTDSKPRVSPTSGARGEAAGDAAGSSLAADPTGASAVVPAQDSHWTSPFRLFVVQVPGRGEVCLCWDADPAAFQLQHPNALPRRFGLQLEQFVPGAQGVQHTIQWLPIDSARGEWLVASARHSVVRAFLGERLPGGEHKVLAVGSNVQLDSPTTGVKAEVQASPDGVPSGATPRLAACFEPGGAQVTFLPAPRLAVAPAVGALLSHLSASGAARYWADGPMCVA